MCSQKLQILSATGNEVFISNKNCGVMTISAVEASFGDGANYQTRQSNIASVYTDQCYRNNLTAQTCTTYVKKELPVNVYKNMSCPFPGNERICLRNSTNLRTDTGFLDSHDHLGINTPPRQRFTFRSVNDCAPLITDLYMRVNTSKPYSSANASVEYLYGTTIGTSEVLRDAATYRCSPTSKNSVLRTWKNHDAQYRLG